MTRKTDNKWIAYVSTFPPRECGIATFTEDLTRSFDQLYSPAIESRIIAMNVQAIGEYHYPKKVILQINQSELSEYIKAAKHVNQNHKIKLVNIQHEFGIFGGNYGNFILKFIEECAKPVVITFHSVLPEPNPELKETVRNLTTLSKNVIVMTNLSKQILMRDYNISEEKIKIIPHGIHSVTYRSSSRAKSGIGLSNKIILSTFGLLSRDKGIEYIIESLPEVVKKFPNVHYLVIGATHPLVRKQEGESYRKFLMQKVYDLGLVEHVRFYDKYLALNTLLEFLQATDIYISGSLNSNQAVSGTLSYALGAGRPVISTAFAQAKEYITNDIGLLVDFKNPEAYTHALLQLLENEEARIMMGKNAYSKTRNMIWSNVTIAYMRNFLNCVPSLNDFEKNLPPIKLSHLIRLTDNFGFFQFADFAIPNSTFGYTLDDNARALLFAGLYYKRFKKPFVLRLIETYLKFIEHVAHPNGTFENYVNYDQTINRELNTKDSLEDANARALYSLMRIYTLEAIPQIYRDRAFKLLYPSLQRDFTSPRAIAFFVKGLYCLISSHKKIAETRNMFHNVSIKKIDLESSLKRHCDKLITLYEAHNSPDWEWFEPLLAYSNSILPEALLVGYSVTQNKNYFELGKKTLNFLIKQTFKNEIYIPIGQSGWYRRGDKRVYFDQQPEDVSAMVQTLKAMYSITQQEQYKKLMYKTFYWFLGDNTLCQFVYDKQTGGCYDGIGEDCLNLNQGAESTISYLLARLAVEK